MGRTEKETPDSYCRLCKCNFKVKVGNLHSQTSLSLGNLMGKYFDAKLLKWKVAIENNDRKLLLLNEIRFRNWI